GSRHQHLDVGGRKARGDQPASYRFGRLRVVADRVGRVDLDQLLVDLAEELLVRRERRGLRAGTTRARSHENRRDDRRQHEETPDDTRAKHDPPPRADILARTRRPADAFLDPRQTTVATYRRRRHSPLPRGDLSDRLLGKDETDAVIQTTSTSTTGRVDFGDCGPPQPPSGFIGCHPVRTDLDVDTQPLSRRAVDAYRSPGIPRLHPPCRDPDGTLQTP